MKILILVLYYLDLQIQAAVVALRNTRGLPWPKDYQKKKDEDILDWLQAMFGFQVK
jgi:callose synthase